MIYTDIVIRLSGLHFSALELKPKYYRTDRLLVLHNTTSTVGKVSTHFSWGGEGRNGKGREGRGREWGWGISVCVCACVCVGVGWGWGWGRGVEEGGGRISGGQRVIGGNC